MEITIISYFVLLCFVVGVIYKAIKISKMPIHLRWELYPLPKEKGKSHYGGSSLEEFEHWEKEHHKDHINEAKAMAEEIFFLDGVRKHNKQLWLGSLPFHLGVYLTIGNVVIASIAVLLKHFEIIRFSQMYYFMAAITILLILSSSSGLIGSLVLLYKRLLDKSLKTYSTPANYFHLVHAAIIFTFGLAWSISDDLLSFSIIEYFKGIFTFSSVNELNIFGYAYIYSLLVFIVYMPYTHLSHFFTKYFTYHKIRWDDELNKAGSKIENNVNNYLNMQVDWQAPHINKSEKNTWVSVVEDKKEENDEK